jgi:hypothetical protein
LGKDLYIAEKEWVRRSRLEENGNGKNKSNVIVAWPFGLRSRLRQSGMPFRLGVLTPG